MISAWTVHARTLRPGEDTFLAVRLERALEPNQVFWPVKTRVEGLLDPKDGASSYDEADPRSVIIHLVNTTDKDVVLRPDDLVCYGSILDDAEDFRVHSSDDQGNASLLEQAQEVQPYVLAHEDEPEEEGWEETKTSEEPPPEPEPPPALHEKENKTQHGLSPTDHRPGNRSARGRTSSAWQLRYDTLVGQFDKVGSVPFVKRLVVYLFSGVGMGSAGAKLSNQRYHTLYQPALAVDIDPEVLSIHRDSFPEVHTLEFRIGLSHVALQEAIAKVIPRNLWEHTLVVTTPDCRTASRANFYCRDLMANAQLTKHSFRSIARARPRFLGFILEQAKEIYREVSREVPNAMIVNLREEKSTLSLESTPAQVSESIDLTLPLS